MDRSSALRRLQRCLRLAASPNANEAATALRQAQKLMAQLGLAEEDARIGDYACCDAPTRQRRPEVPVHLAGLANLVALTFRCTMLMGWSPKGSRTIKFVGLRSNAELAAYAFTVLRRQLEADASRHARRTRKTSTRTRKMVLFAQGWVYAVEAMLEAPPLTEEEEASANRYVELHYGGALATVRLRDAPQANRRSIDDVVAGYCAGREARLHAGINGAARSPGQRQLTAS